MRKTLLSAALQEYPDLRVVLLIDDPPNPTSGSDRAGLRAIRRLTVQVQELLSEPANRFDRALARFESSGGRGGGATGELATEYEFAATWLDRLAADQTIVDHTDQFFVEHVLGNLGQDLTTTARALRAAVADGAALPAHRLAQLHRRLAWTFRAEITSFERKRYVSLSHEANKAMNLNSYIGLMGGSYHEVQTVAGARPAADAHQGRPTSTSPTPTTC